MENFTNIFSGLRPVQSVHKPESDVETAFVLSVINGEPFLSLPKEGDPVTPAQRRIWMELDRLADGFDDIDSSWTCPSAAEVSLWQNPHLLYMLKDVKIVGPDNTPVTFADTTAELSILLTTDPGSNDKDTKYSTSVTLTTPDARYSEMTVLGETSVLAGNTIYPVRPLGPNFADLRNLLQPVAATDAETYLSLLLTFLANVNVSINGHGMKFIKEPVPSVPTLVLEKVATDQALYLRTANMTEGAETTGGGTAELTRICSITRDGTVEVRPVESRDLNQLNDQLEELILKNAPTRNARKDVFRDNNFFIIPAETASPFLINSLPEVLRHFQLLGSEKLKEYKVVPASPKVNLRLSSGIDFLEGDADITVGNESFTLADFLAQYRKNRYVQLSDGNRAIIDEKYINRLQRLFTANRDKKNGKIKVTLFDLPEIEDLIQNKIKGTFAARTREVFEGFNKLKNAKPLDPDVHATLRAYQKEGVKWLKYLHDTDLGGCLADDMGLGKTLQTISLLTLVYPAASNPSVIVMPRSLLFNWEKELARFAPQLRVKTYYGPDRNLDETLLDTDVILTTYAMMRNDIEALQKVKFEYVILDESQNIKNVASQTAQAVVLLDAAHRLALSGTPMENNLTELYSLFRFLNPTMFGTLDEFNNLYTWPIQKRGDKDATRSLRRRIFPFMLRRVKQDVLKDLPDRIDQTMYVEMSEHQRALYEKKRREFRQEIDNAIATQGLQKSSFLILQALNELRRIASVPESITDNRIKSPKIDELIEALHTAVENNHKVVVFFNFIAGMEIVGQRLEQLGIECETMSGSTTTPARKKIVERFQTDPECKVLLMTLKVGGVGLNLTAADTVFIFEPWWNKAAEEQAINRLHRIGQKATVTSYQMITVDTIEEKIRLLQDQKQQLFDSLIDADSTAGKQLTQEDIDFILS